MPAVIGRRVRTTQPQQNPQIDWSNPITAGLVFAYTMSNEAQGWGEDGRTGVSYVKTSDTSVTYGRAINTLTGTAGQLLSSSSAYLFGTPSQTSVKSGVYSLFAFGTGAATGIQSAIDDDDGTNRRFQFRINAGKVELNPFYSGGNGSVAAPAALSATDLATGFAMGAVVNGTSYAIFQKGVKTAATMPSSALTPNSIVNIGARKTGSTQCWLVGGLMLVAMWNRPLADAEHASLADNPWQLFKPAMRRLWLAYSASDGSIYGTFSGATSADLSSAGLLSAIGTFAPSVSLSGMNATGLVGSSASGTIASSLADAGMAASGTQNNSGTVNSLLGGTTMLSSGNIASPATGTILASLMDASMSAFGYQGATIPPAVLTYRRRAPHRIVN